MREEHIPSIGRESHNDSGQNGNVVGFECANGPLSHVLVMHVGRDELVVALPLVGDVVAVGSTGLIVEDDSVDHEAKGAEPGHDDVSRRDAVAVMLGCEGLHQDDIGGMMVGDHNVLVAALHLDWESTCVIRVETTER